MQEAWELFPHTKGALVQSSAEWNGTYCHAGCCCGLLTTCLLWKRAFNIFQYILLGGGLKYFWFSPRTLGKISNLINIFQMGWINHQPVSYPRASLPLVQGLLASLVWPELLSVGRAFEHGWQAPKRQPPHRTIYWDGLSLIQICWVKFTYRIWSNFQKQFRYFRYTQTSIDVGTMESGGWMVGVFLNHWDFNGPYCCFYFASLTNRYVLWWCTCLSKASWKSRLEAILQRLDIRDQFDFVLTSYAAGVDAWWLGLYIVSLLFFSCSSSPPRAVYKYDISLFL